AADNAERRVRPNTRAAHVSVNREPNAVVFRTIVAGDRNPEDLRASIERQVNADVSTYSLRSCPIDDSVACDELCAQRSSVQQARAAEHDSKRTVTWSRSVQIADVAFVDPLDERVDSPAR